MQSMTSDDVKNGTTYLSVMQRCLNTGFAVGGWYGTTYCKYLTKVSKNSPSSTGRH